jgi:hypothetical protein
MFFLRCRNSTIALTPPSTLILVLGFLTFLNLLIQKKCHKQILLLIFQILHFVMNSYKAEKLKDRSYNNLNGEIG